MNLQQGRRHDPYPWTWEIPAGVAAAVALTIVIAIHVGRAGANLVAGSGLRLTRREELFTSVWPILTGDAGAGLTESPAHVASGRALAVWVVLTLALMLALLVWFIVYVIGRWGPSRVLGMATPADTEELLGVTRLRRNAAIIRPDLYTDQRGKR